MHLTFYSELLSQGWGLHLGCDGFTLRDRKENLVVKIPMSNNTFTVMLWMTYPDFGLPVPGA